MINVDANIAARFWGYVQKLDADSCWNWTGATSKSGKSITGKWMPPRQSALSCQVHRAAWQLTYGEVPAGKRIKHTCDSLLCCNPSHLKVADDLEERFWSKVDKTPGQGKGDCWMWTARIGTNGYGQFRPDPKKAHTNAQRVAYELANGKSPGASVVCHRCDFPACCNPFHLFLGTTKDNIHDMIKKGRSNFIPPPAPPKGEAHPNASVTEEQVRDIKAMFDSGATYREVIDKHGVSKGTAYNIKIGKYWGHVK